jgi:hypothetical protein
MRHGDLNIGDHIYADGGTVPWFMQKKGHKEMNRFISPSAHQVIRPRQAVDTKLLRRKYSPTFIPRTKNKLKFYKLILVPTDTFPCES